MQLTTLTDYALRTLMYLAAVPGRATAGQIAELYGISTNHIAKVVNLLARRGYIRSIRGIGGGIELAQAPEEIRLGEVISAFEDATHLLQCVDVENVCSIQRFCKLKNVLAEAERIQLAYLNGVTLRDVAPAGRQLMRIAPQ